MIQKELIDKYFEGQCDPEELKIVLEWLNDENADHSLLQEIMTARWEAERHFSGSEVLKPRLLSALQQRLYPFAATPEEISSPMPVIGTRRKFFRYGIAASVAGLLFLGAFVFNYYRLRSLAAQWRSLTNTSTRMKYCLLPDSTSVWLNPKSTLSWSMPFDAQRTVRIEGQAFFDVAKDESRPFLVNSGPIAVKVLGTAFNIEAYPDEKDIRISLVNGKVGIQTAKETVEILNSGEMFTYIKDAHLSRKAPLKMTGLSDWTSGHLMFSETPVKTALERMERLYHFHLRYGKDVHLENYRFSTVFTKEETPEQMIKNILFITGYTYRITGTEVEIISK